MSDRNSLGENFQGEIIFMNSITCMGDSGKKVHSGMLLTSEIDLFA